MTFTNDMMDEDDRQLINEALQTITEPTQTACTDPRHKLTEIFIDFYQDVNLYFLLFKSDFLFVIIPIHNSYI